MWGFQAWVSTARPAVAEEVSRCAAAAISFLQVIIYIILSVACGGLAWPGCVQK